MSKNNVLLTLTIIFSPCIAMQPNAKIELIVVPGQNGLGGIINGEIHSNTDVVLPQFQYKRYFVETPQYIPDFGQGRCQRYLQHKLQYCRDYFGIQSNNIIHASSQGTATTLNHTAHDPANIKALILESVMLTGNSAISHTLKSRYPLITSLPGSYYWLPYVAKIAFPNYAPAGEQPIFNIDKLPENLPIIIIHNTYDPQLSFKDAQALYAHLKNKGNDNVYLFPHNNGELAHVLLLEKHQNQTEITAIQEILKQHDLLPNEENIPTQNINLTQYQPDINQEWLDHFNHLLSKEKKLWYFDKALKGSLFLLFAYFMSKTDAGHNFLATILGK